MTNRYGFNGGNEYEDEGELNYSNTFYRKYDAQIGRFTGVDMKSEMTVSLNPYHFGGDNPVMFNDPLGDRMHKGEDGQYHPDWYNDLMWGGGAGGVYGGYTGGGGGGGFGGGIYINAERGGEDGKADINTFTDLLGSITGNTYNVLDGKLNRLNEILNLETNTTKSGELSLLVDIIMRGDKAITFNIANGNEVNKGLKFDSYESARLDLNDFKSVTGKLRNVFLVGVFTHIFVEYKNLPSDLSKRTEKLFDKAHEKGKIIESQYMSKMLGVTLTTRKEIWADKDGNIGPNILFRTYTWDYGKIRFQADYLVGKMNIRNWITYPITGTILFFR